MWASLILLTAANGVGQDATTLSGLPDFEIPKIPLWYDDYVLRSGFGYKDNLLLSSAARARGSAFWSAGADVMFYRLPSAGWQFHLLASFDHSRYFDEHAGVEGEQSGAVITQGSLNLGQDWKMSLGVNYLYQDQVLDTTVTQTNQTIGKILGHYLAERVQMRKDFKPCWFEAEVSLARQWLAAPLDDYWQPSARLSLGRSSGRGSTISLSYRPAWTIFDQRAQADASGYSVPGAKLRFFTHTAECAWPSVWDAPGRWQSEAKAGVDFNEDNGAGYFDYRRYRVSGKLRYRAKTWELAGSVRFDLYDFPVQTVSLEDSSLREKQTLTLQLRAQKSLGKSFKVFANYSHERSFSNTDYDHYQANAVSAGVEFGF